MTEPTSAVKQKSWLANTSLRRFAQAAVTLGAFWYLFSIVNTRELGQAFARVSSSSWLAAILLTSLALTCGVLRWWLLFQAFGAVRIPSLPTLGKYYLLGFFYNTYLPGGVSGDVVRGLASQHAWPPGSAGGFAIVLMERAVGLTALLGLTATATLLHPLPGMAQLWLPACAAFVAVSGTTLALAISNRLAAFMPGALRRLLERLPPPSAWPPLGAALALSLVTQLAPAVSGYVLIHAIVPSVTLLDSLVIVPLASAAAFLPITISGAGVRETLFVALYALVGIPAQASLAASLALWLAQASVAAIGGIYMLVAKDPWRASATGS
jgi:uncharacterized membrane protein YbhN (UPF0104 family)